MTYNRVRNKEYSQQGIHFSYCGIFLYKIDLFIVYEKHILINKGIYNGHHAPKFNK